MSDQFQNYPPPQPAYGYQPDPQITPQAERSLGTLAHVIPVIAMICTAGTMGFVASLVLYLMYKDRGPFVRENAANSLNVQITMLIWLVVSIPLVLAAGLGILTFIFAPFIAGLLHIMGAIKANNGEWWNPPLTPHFVR